MYKLIVPLILVVYISTMAFTAPVPIVKEYVKVNKDDYDKLLTYETDAKSYRKLIEDLDKNRSKIDSNNSEITLTINVPAVGRCIPTVDY